MKVWLFTPNLTKALTNVTLNFQAFSIFRVDFFFLDTVRDLSVYANKANNPSWLELVKIELILCMIAYLWHLCVVFMRELFLSLLHLEFVHDKICKFVFSKRGLVVKFAHLMSSCIRTILGEEHTGFEGFLKATQYQHFQTT